MTARALAVALALTLAAPPALAADGAVRRGSGGGGGGGSDKQAAGARHHSGGGSSSGNVSRGGGGSYDRGGSRPVSGAEARHPRAGTGTGYYRKGGYYGGYGGYGGYYGRYGGYYPYYGYGYYPYYGGYWDGYWGWGASLGWGSPYYGTSGYFSYSSPGYYRSSGYGVGSLRLIVKPERTKVYVDGYYTGEVDEFDGLMQRLDLSAGRHEIAFKLDGYRDYRVKVYVAVDRTLKLKHAMEKGSGPEVVEDLTEGHGEDPEPARQAEGWDERDPRAEPEQGEPREPVSDRRPAARDLGSVRFDVTPEDASVYVDGEFQGSARRLGELDLRAGRHRVEVVRPGFETVERDIEIEPGRVARIAIDLTRR